MHQNILEKVIKSFLDDNIHELPTVAVSGGIDSLTLAVFISKLFNEKKINIAHAIGPAVPIEATNRVKKLAKEFNWNLNIINTNEINDPRYRANPINRCFFCKENLYSTIKNYTQGITNPRIENISNKAITNGATSLKVTGAGGGGHLYVFAEPRYHMKITKALQKLGVQKVNFEYENSGSAVFDLNNLKTTK